MDSSYAVLHFVAQAAAVEENPGSYEQYINRHNYGYLLKYDREFKIAVYDARLICYMALPDFDVNFRELPINCLFHVNISISEQCSLMVSLRRAIWKTHRYNQRYISR